MKLIEISGEEALFQLDKDDLLYRKGNNLYVKNREDNYSIYIRNNEYLTGFFWTDTFSKLPKLQKNIIQSKNKPLPLSRGQIFQICIFTLSLKVQTNHAL